MNSFIEIVATLLKTTVLLRILSFAVYQVYQVLLSLKPIRPIVIFDFSVLSLQIENNLNVCILVRVPILIKVSLAFLFVSLQSISNIHRDT